MSALRFGGPEKTTAKADELVVYDTIAYTLALLPMLVWPAILRTTPAALFVVVYGWRKPRSLVRPGPRRLITDGVVAALQLGAWITLGLMHQAND